MDKKDFTYTSCYCEENTYLLLEKLIPKENENYYSIVLTNKNKTIGERILFFFFKSKWKGIVIPPRPIKF